MIDALETAARRRADQVGLTLCNRTRGRMWTAVARRRGEGWESRGWWPLSPGGCVRTIDEVLIQDVYFVHAMLESRDGPRYLAAGGEPFCTSAARFAILGREHCDTRYYQTTLFTPISARDRDGLVVDFEERDFLEPGVAPRQLQAAPQASPTLPRCARARPAGWSRKARRHRTGPRRRLRAAAQSRASAGPAASPQSRPAHEPPFAVSARFAGIREWVFDLDNTLYPAPTLYDAIGERMTAYIARAVGVGCERSAGAARALLPGLRRDGGGACQASRRRSGRFRGLRARRRLFRARARSRTRRADRRAAGPQDRVHQWRRRARPARLGARLGLAQAVRRACSISRRPAARPSRSRRPMRA